MTQQLLFLGCFASYAIIYDALDSLVVFFQLVL